VAFGIITSFLKPKYKLLIIFGKNPYFFKHLADYKKGELQICSSPFNS